MNEKKIFEKQEKKINFQKEKISELEASNKQLNDSVIVLQDALQELNYFTLKGNDNAMSYFESFGVEAADIEKMVSEYIYEKNLTKGDNDLIPYEGINGAMKINKLKFLNHRWILADFTDGRYWGEFLIEYYVNKDNSIELKDIASLLYASN